MTGQNDRQDRSLTGQVRDQAGHCPLTGRYLQPCKVCYIFVCPLISQIYFLCRHYSFTLLSSMVTMATLPCHLHINILSQFPVNSDYSII